MSRPPQHNVNYENQESKDSVDSRYNSRLRELGARERDLPKGRFLAGLISSINPHFTVKEQNHISAMEEETGMNFIDIVRSRILESSEEISIKKKTTTMLMEEGFGNIIGNLVTIKKLLISNKQNVDLANNAQPELPSIQDQLTEIKKQLDEKNRSNIDIRDLQVINYNLNILNDEIAKIRNSTRLTAFASIQSLDDEMTEDEIIDGEVEPSREFINRACGRGEDADKF